MENKNQFNVVIRRYIDACIDRLDISTEYKLEYMKSNSPEDMQIYIEFLQRQTTAKQMYNSIENYMDDALRKRVPHYFNADHSYVRMITQLRNNLIACRYNHDIEYNKRYDEYMNANEQVIKAVSDESIEVITRYLENIIVFMNTN
jgi:hypothetical protein